MIFLFGLHYCIYKYKVWYVKVWVDKYSITCLWDFLYGEEFCSYGYVFHDL